ncbi:MAG: OmpA family protein [Putridiphycobacter sp.]|nr:OmpA family protein [Putridiphycobacter sp.]
MKKILFLLALLVGYNGVSQVVDEPFDKMVLGDKPGFNNAIREIKLGDLHFERGSEEDMAEALPHYMVADSFHSKSAYLNYRIGVCYLSSTQKYKALERLEFVKATGGNEKDYPDLDFHLAQAYHLDGQFEKSIALFRGYKETLGESDAEMRFFINKKIQECKVGMELAKTPVRVWVDNLGPQVNSKYSDFGPVISADNRELYFTSRRPEGNIGKEKDETGYLYEDIYFSTREFEGDWNAAQNIGTTVNTKSHDATVGLSPDGKSLITYHGVSRKNGNLLITRKDANGEWEKLENIGSSINTDYHEEAATLSFDEKKLFFVTDKPGGLGGHDIYMALWDEAKNTWGEPVNLGAPVNTEFDEKGVFFHPDNKTLYFSSSGHRTMGGLDIFKTEYNAETNEWSEPVNIGYPINTPDDDVYYVVSGNERYAYFSSVREGGFGEKDIYQITFLGEKKEPLYASSGLVSGALPIAERAVAENYEKTDMVIVSGQVKDKDNGGGLSSVITFMDANTNEKIYEVMPDANGNYMMVVETGRNYAITSTKAGYTLASENLVLRSEDEGKDYVVDFSMQRLEEGAEFVLRNIYFDFDKSTLRHESVDELNRLVKIMEENPTLRIELTGHTDSRGVTWYNNALSKRRSKVARDYLVSKGIASNRIETKGMGAKQLEVSDEAIENFATVREKEEGHQRNRRTVVKVIGQ